MAASKQRFCERIIIVQTVHLSVWGECEVREVASDTISSLMRCGMFIPTTAVQTLITVVNPAPTPTNVNEGDIDDIESLTLQELKKFLPILPSSTKGSEIPLNEIKDLLKWKQILQIVAIYKDHLKRCSQKVSTEQRILASRLKDIDLFATGVVHNFSSRHEKTGKLAQQIKAVDELSQLVQQSLSALEDCVVLANKMNSMLPEKERLETFHVQTTS